MRRRQGWPESQSSEYSLFLFFPKRLAPPQLLHKNWVVIGSQIGQFHLPPGEADTAGMTMSTLTLSPAETRKVGEIAHDAAPPFTQSTYCPGTTIGNSNDPSD